jgi:hypothetical protein
MHQDLLGRPEGRPEREEELERPGDGVHPLLDLRRHIPDHLHRPDSLLVSLPVSLYRPDSLLVSRPVSLYRPDSLLVSRLYNRLHLHPLE